MAEDITRYECSCRTDDSPSMCRIRLCAPKERSAQVLSAFGIRAP